jgi:hypothetical protein
MASVAIHIEQGRHQHRHERQAKRDREIYPEGRRLAVHRVEGERDHACAEDQRPEPKREDGERQRDTNKKRPEDCIDKRHNHGYK